MPTPDRAEEVSQSTSEPQVGATPMTPEQSVVLPELPERDIIGDAGQFRDEDLWSRDSVIAFARAAVLAERQKCAVIALDEMVEVVSEQDEAYNTACEHVAAAIRKGNP